MNWEYLSIQLYRNGIDLGRNSIAAIAVNADTQGTTLAEIYDVMIQEIMINTPANGGDTSCSNWTNIKFSLDDSKGEEYAIKTFARAEFDAEPDIATFIVQTYNELLTQL